MTDHPLDKVIIGMEDLIKTLEFVEAEISKFQWINVEERLPQKDQKILFYVLDRDQIYAGYYSIDSSRSTIAVPRFRENLHDWCFDEEDITHWMPLPNPPEKE